MTPSNLFEARADRMNGGLNLNTDRNLEPEEISGGQALRFEPGAGIMTGPGYRVTATVNDGKGGEGALEANFLRTSAWAKVGTKIKYTHDAVTWYDTGETLTDGERQGFCGQGNGDILTSNQTDTPIVFAVGKLAAAATQAGAILNVGTVYVDKFTATGTVYVQGTAVPYTGKSGGTLTGATIPAAGFPADALVIQKRTQTTWVEEKGTILLPYESRLLVMNVKDRENIIYHSAIEDLSNPQFFYDFDGNGAYQHIMPRRITAAIAGVGGGYIFMDKGIHQILGFDLASGNLLTKELSREEGAYNQNCVVDAGGIVHFLGRKRFTPITLTLTPEAEAAPFLGEKFDEPIRPWLETHDDFDDQDAAYLKWDSTQRLTKIGANVGGALQTYVHDRQNPGFLPKENRNVGASFMLNGKSYFLHRDNGKCYEDDVGRTNDGIPITHSFITGDIQYDEGRRFLKGQYLSYEGWMTQGTLHRVRVYLGGSEEAAFDQEYSWDDLCDLTKQRSIGLRGIGLSSPGGSSDETVTTYAFQNDILLRGLNEDSFRIEWEISGDGHFLLMRSWYLSAHIPRRQPRTKV